MDEPKQPSEKRVQSPEREKNSKTQVDNSKQKLAAAESDSSVGKCIKSSLDSGAEANVVPLATKEKVVLAPPKMRTCEENLPKNSVASQQVQQQQQQQKQQRIVFLRRLPQTGQQQQQNRLVYRMIWKGILEWYVENNQPPEMPEETRSNPCVVSTRLINGKPEVNAETWSESFIMQLLPRELVRSACSAHLKNSKCVILSPKRCEELKSLYEDLTLNRYVGCARLNGSSTSEDEGVKILVLAYCTHKKLFIGIIPNDQVAFVGDLFKYVEQVNAIKRRSKMKTSQGAMPESMQLPPNPNAPDDSGTNQMLMLKNEITAFLKVAIRVIPCKVHE